MTCIQGFICAVPTKNRGVFIQHAQKAAQAFHDYGCVAAVECWGDDVTSCDVPSFPAAVLAQPDETVFSWVQWADRATRDAGNEKIMNDPRLAAFGMPFDSKRLIFGGFQPVVEVG